MRNWEKMRLVPGLVQESSNTCGLGALRNLFAHFGFYILENELRQLLVAATGRKINDCGVFSADVGLLTRILGFQTEWHSGQQVLMELEQKVGTIEQLCSTSVVCHDSRTLAFVESVKHYLRIGGRLRVRPKEQAPNITDVTEKLQSGHCAIVRVEAHDYYGLTNEIWGHFLVCIPDREYTQVLDCYAEMGALEFGASKWQTCMESARNYNWGHWSDEFIAIGLSR